MVSFIDDLLSGKLTLAVIGVGRLVVKPLKIGYKIRVCVNFGMIIITIFRGKKHPMFSPNFHLID